MPFFVLKAHETQSSYHGKDYRFTRPLFSSKLERPQDHGLYISITDMDNPLQRSYLFLSTVFVLELMEGWGNQRTCIDRIVEFAEQNVEEFKRFVLNVFSDPANNLTKVDPWILGSDEDAIHIYTFAAPKQ